MSRHPENVKTKSNPHPMQAERSLSTHIPRPIGLTSTFKHISFGNQKFQPLPAPTGPEPYHLLLENILSGEQIKAIDSAGKIIFHTVGDTGNYMSSSDFQHAVADTMEADYNSSVEKPSFFYHLGDVVYFNGKADQYYPQFYSPYIKYPPHIFSIPGNHDGDPASGDPPSLTAYVNNFCAHEAHYTPEAHDANRQAMIQPNVYWTLEAPYATIIGLYSNVPAGGEIRDTQLAWFADELGNARKDRALIVALHHPVYSLDNFHGGSTQMEETLDNCYKKAGRRADVVLTAHVHNFQRYTERVDGAEIPHVVAGAGGHHPLHAMQKQSDGNPIQVPFKLNDADDVTLENYCDNRHGFMRFEVTESLIKGEYYAVDVNIADPQSDAQARLLDTFELNYRKHQLSKSTRVPQ
jgi:acid phosphatase type 7